MTYKQTWEVHFQPPNEILPCIFIAPRCTSSEAMTLFQQNIPPHQRGRSSLWRLEPEDDYS